MSAAERVAIVAFAAIFFTLIVLGCRITWRERGYQRQAER